MSTVRIHDSPPAGLADTDAAGLQALLGGPSLIHVRGIRDMPLFVSVLLHGNEVSGWNGLRRLLASPEPLARSLLVFIGNVDAAARGLRMLPGQRDFNRIWRGEVTGAEGEMARTVADYVQRRPLFAAVDLHNNTGHNPHYTVLTRLDAHCHGLAFMFSRKAVYIEEPDTVLARLFDHLCPAVTLELGPVGDPACEDRALDYLQRCLALESVPGSGPVDLYQTRVRVHVRDGISFSFADDGLATPLVLTGGVEAVNFHALPAGTRFGRSSRPLTEVLSVLDITHRDVTDEYLVRRDGEIELRRPVIPAMYTTDPLVVRQDCLCYFMEPMELPAGGDANLPV
jgi:succinylglutamate desuccinylase